MSFLKRLSRTQLAMAAYVAVCVISLILLMITSLRALVFVPSACILFMIVQRHRHQRRKGAPHTD
jgi:membrane protein implicated in regulation of membrane protease activity